MTNDQLSYTFCCIKFIYSCHSLSFTLYDVIEEDKYNQDKWIRRELILSGYSSSSSDAVSFLRSDFHSGADLEHVVIVSVILIRLQQVTIIITSWPSSSPFYSSSPLSPWVFAPSPPAPAPPSVSSPQWSHRRGRGHTPDRDDDNDSDWWQWCYYLRGIERNVAWVTEIVTLVFVDWLCC